MKKISLTNRAQTIRENTTIMPEGYSGWLAQNIGNAAVSIDGFVLKPGDRLDFTRVESDAVWSTPIQIICQNGGAVRIMRLIYSDGNSDQSNKKED